MIPLWENHCEWHKMTLDDRAGLRGVCNLINTISATRLKSGSPDRPMTQNVSTFQSTIGGNKIVLRYSSTDGNIALIDD